jgi:hypothetical protein
MDPRIVVAGDDGTPYLSSSEDSPATRAFAGVLKAIETRLPPVKAPVSLNMTSGCGCGCGSSR